MINALTQLNRFFDLATETKLSGSDQLVYLHLFNKFNRAHWTETLLVRDAELQELCRLHGNDGKPMHINTIRNIKQRLKAKGFIDFVSGKGNAPTEYRLIDLTPCGSPCGTGLVFYTHAREEDVKTLRQKREKKQKREKNMKEGDNNDRPSTSKKLSAERHYAEPDTSNDPDDLYKYM